MFGESEAPLPLRPDKEFRIQYRLKLERLMAQKQRFVRDFPMFTNHYLKKIMYFNHKCIESDLKWFFGGRGRILFMP